MKNARDDPGIFGLLQRAFECESGDSLKLYKLRVPYKHIRNLKGLTEIKCESSYIKILSLLKNQLLTNRSMKQILNEYLHYNITPSRKFVSVWIRNFSHTIIKPLRLVFRPGNSNYSNAFPLNQFQINRENNMESALTSRPSVRISNEYTLRA